MGKKVIILGAVFVLAIGGWFAISRWYPVSGLNNLAQNFSTLGDTLSALTPNISAPGPLRAKTKAPDAFLTVDGVLEWTNNNRAQNDRRPLKLNVVLNQAAQAKVNDMFARQYFDHVSPDGHGPDYWPTQTGYQFISVGENLALGNFLNDQELVTAWMNSPGHRENILTPTFEEIGIAVKQGTFEGEQTWLAVQVFGRPKTACPALDATLKANIDTNQAQIDIWQPQIEELQRRLRDERPHGQYTQEQADAYNALVDEFNALGAQYNALVTETKTLVDQYNQGVKAYNECAQQ